MSIRTFIVDTNVLVAGLISAAPGSPTGNIVDAMFSGRLVYLISPDLLNEYRDVLLRPKIARLHGLDESAVDLLLAEITANAIWREPLSKTCLSAPDPGDDHLWSLLETEPGTILITGDHRLMDSPMPQRSIISPATWAAHFKSR
jgi:uncharacterized protein